MFHPITKDVLHQVYDPYGLVEEIIIFEESHLNLFHSKQSTLYPKFYLQGWRIYDACCQLDIQFANNEKCMEVVMKNIIKKEKKKKHYLTM